MNDAAASKLERPAVRWVREALAELGYGDSVIELAETARSTADTASALGVAQGAIVKSLVFDVDGTMVMALVAGDRQCVPESLPCVLGLDGAARRPDAKAVKAATGFSIGGVAPVGMLTALPTAVDRSLERFETVYAAAGHPHCVFPTTVDDLVRMSRGVPSGDISAAG